MASKRIAPSSSAKLPVSHAPRADESRFLALLPPEVPSLPEETVARPDLISALKQSVMHAEAGSCATSVTAPASLKKSASQLGGSVTAAAGMGGVGKTMTAAALVSDEEVRAHFDKICWVSVGQEPDMAALQQTLYRQLVKRPLPESAKNDDKIALDMLKDAVKEQKVLPWLDLTHFSYLPYFLPYSQRSLTILSPSFHHPSPSFTILHHPFPILHHPLPFFTILHHTHQSFHTSHAHHTYHTYTHHTHHNYQSFHTFHAYHTGDTRAR